MFQFKRFNGGVPMSICLRLATTVMSPANSVEKKQTMKSKNPQGTSGAGAGIVIGI